MRRKIQFILHYSELYGANRSLHSIITYLHSKDFEVQVLLPFQGSMVSKLESQNIPFKILPYFASFLYIRPKVKYLLLPFLIAFNFIIFPLILWKVKKFNPDVIYSNTSAENIGVIISKLLRKKHITHVREFMSKDYQSYFIFGKNIKRRFIGLSDGIIFVSNAVKKSILGTKGVSSLTQVIYNGIATPDLFHEKINVPTTPNFGLVGLIDPGKDQLKALEYFKRILSIYPGAKLNFYGDGSGDYKKQVVGRVNELGIQNDVVFHGFIENIDQIYKFDILFMFSKSEGFGRVTAEAMLRGIPVIGYDNAGTSELIHHGKTGYLFHDYESFENSLEGLLSSDDSFNYIRWNAYNSIKKTCDLNLYSENVLQFINSVFKKNK